MAKVVKIFSENNDFQRAEVLTRNREKRTKYREFIIEGVIPINQALKHGWTIKSCLYSPEKGVSDWAKHILKTAHADTHYELPLALLEKLSEKEETSELLAIGAIPDDKLDRIKLGPNQVLVVFDRPNSPGNLGSSLRSCDAFGAAGVVITGHAADIYHPQAVRGSMGSLFALPVVRVPSQNELFAWLEKKRKEFDIHVVGTGAEASINLGDYEFPGATVLIFGNETFGLSSGYREACETVLKIPMLGSADSLNVSCAASIVLYESARRRVNA